MSLTDRMGDEPGADIRLSRDLTFAEALEELHRRAYFGTVIIHMAEGVAHTIEIPGAPTRIKLDKPHRRA